MSSQDPFDEEIDPNKWNQKELLKHVYRKLEALETILEGRENSKNIEMELLRKRLDSLEQFRSFALGISKAVLIFSSFVGLVIAALQIFVK